jgi:CDP-paratose 2-epimerase
MSTNKVYGDGPNRPNLVEKELRWDYADPEYANGIGETLSIDQSMHSLFGASKAAADLMVQEYGRDNIHFYDVVRFMHQFIQNPRCAEVYNIGGGRENSISILEAFSLIQQISGIEMSYECLDQNRKRDHICYISDLSRMKEHYPQWGITKDLKATFVEIYEPWTQRERR